MDMNELQEKVQMMGKELQRLKDIEAIRRLQHIYGFYLTTWMNEEIINLFSDSRETSVDFPQGTFFAKEGIKIAFGHTNTDMNPEYMHQLMQLQGVIDIATDGKTAKGRWWGFGAMALPESENFNLAANDQGILQEFACGVYENEYIKEDGVWKLWKLKWIPLYTCSPDNGWVKPERLTKLPLVNEGQAKFPSWWKPDIPPKGIDYAYPSGYILPFHYKHPVTGKESTENKRNARVKGIIKHR